MAVAIIGLAVGFILLYDIQQEKNAESISPKSLNQMLDESNERLSVIKDDFYNGQYNGEIPIKEVISTITNEVEIQKALLEQYKQLPNETKTDKTIDTRFFQLSKYYWAGEEVMLKALQKQLLD